MVQRRPWRAKRDRRLVVKARDYSRVRRGEARAVMWSAAVEVGVDVVGEVVGVDEAVVVEVRGGVGGLVEVGVDVVGEVVGVEDVVEVEFGGAGGEEDLGAGDG